MSYQTTYSSSSNKKFGNTSQSIVTVPRSFFTKELIPMEIFNITKKDSYFKEKTLFQEARQLNINNNPIKNHRKFDEFNKEKYVPLHLLPTVPPPDNKYNPHYRRDFSKEKRSLFKSFVNLPHFQSVSKNYIDDDQALNNDFHLFSQLNMENEKEELKKQAEYERILRKSSSFNVKKYEIHEKKRYNKEFYKYYDMNQRNNSRVKSKLKKVKINKDDENDVIDRKTEKIRPILKKLEMDTKETKENHIKNSNNHGLNHKPNQNLIKPMIINQALEDEYNMYKDFLNQGRKYKPDKSLQIRTKIDNLISKLNSNYDTNKWINTDFTEFYSQINDVMYTPLSYFNKNNSSESHNFKTVLLSKISQMRLPVKKKEELLFVFNKTIETKNLEEDTKEDNGFQSNFHKNHENERRFLLKNQTQIEFDSKNKVENIEKEHKNTYLKYAPSKLYSGFISPTYAEFMDKKGEKFSNRYRSLLSKDLIRIYKEETQSKDTTESNKVMFNFEDKTKYLKLKI